MSDTLESVTAKLDALYEQSVDLKQQELAIRAKRTAVHDEIAALAEQQAALRAQPAASGDVVVLPTPASLGAKGN